MSIAETRASLLGTLRTGAATRSTDMSATSARVAMVALCLAALVLQDAHVAENVGVIGPALEQDLVDDLGLVELAELVALDGERQRLLGREADLAIGGFGRAGAIGGLGGGVHRPAVSIVALLRG